MGGRRSTFNCCDQGEYRSNPVSRKGPVGALQTVTILSPFDLIGPVAVCAGLKWCGVQESNLVPDELKASIHAGFGLAPSNFGHTLAKKFSGLPARFLAASLLNPATVMPVDHFGVPVAHLFGDVKWIHAG